MSDEFQQLSAFDELERLKTITPQWAEAVPEPFLRSPQQDVTPPAWNKVDWGRNNGSAESNQGSNPSPNVFFIAGVQNAGGQFEIKIVGVNGTISDPPV